MKENDFTFRLQSVAGGAAAAPAPKKNALVDKVCLFRGSRG